MTTATTPRRAANDECDRTKSGACAWDSGPDDDGAACLHAHLLHKLGRKAGEACVELDSLDVARRHVVDVEVGHVDAVEKIRRRTIGPAREAQRHPAHDVG